MIYTIRHLTAYRYRNPVGLARCNLRLVPRDGDGQVLLATQLDVKPAPSERRVRADFFVPATVLTIDTPHREFQVLATSRVDVDRRPWPDRTPAWEVVRDLAFASPSLGRDSPVHFLYPSRRVPLDPAVRDYARASFPHGRPLLEAAAELMARMHADFTFDSKATTASTPLSESFAARRGVCQDFAHILVAGLRALGLPAAYVSGYLRTTPPPGRKRLVGADASHAWASLWVGDRWVGLDPTNGIAAGNHHVVLAQGRDYADVAPLDGIILSSSSQKIRVAVDVVPEGEEDGAVGRESSPSGISACS